MSLPVSPASIDLALLQNKNSEDLALLNQPILDTLNNISNQMNGGTVAIIENLLYIILIVAFSYGQIYQNSAYQDLSQISNCNANISNSTGIYKILSWAGIGICAVRVVLSKLFIGLSSTFTAIFELVLGLIVWTLFLILMIISITMKNTLNNTAKCSASDAQVAILQAAKDRCNNEYQMAVGGFVATTLYTIVNILRYYLTVTNIIPLERKKQGDDLRNNVFPASALSPQAGTVSAILTANPEVDASKEISIAGIAS